jgi:hypothetical protein
MSYLFMFHWLLRSYFRTRMTRIEWIYTDFPQQFRSIRVIRAALTKY